MAAIGANVSFNEQHRGPGSIHPKRSSVDYVPAFVCLNSFAAASRGRRDACAPNLTIVLDVNVSGTYNIRLFPDAALLEFR
jgi:hypothetical protein